MSKPLLDIIYLDDVLDKFSIYSRYHAVSAAWITLALIYDAIICVNYVFVAQDVQYRCAEINETLKVPNELNVSNAQDTIAICKTAESCTRWIYDNPDSFVAELACQDWKRTLVGTVHSFGYMVGLLLIGPLSDKFGRKPLVIITGVTGGICGLAKSFITTYWVYIGFEFLEAAFGEPYTPLFMIALEMVSTKARVKYTTICNLGFPIGGVIFPFIYWLISYWRTFLRVVYAPGLLFVFVTYLLDESPRWLLVQEKSKAAVKIIEKAAKTNKIEIKENLEKLTCEKDGSSNFKTAITETFKSKTLLKSCFVCLIWWIVSVFVNYGLSINSVSLDGNKFVNYALSSGVEFPSYLISAYLMDKFNRKGPLICSFVACAVLCVGQPFIPYNFGWLSISMYMMGKFICNVFFTITYIFTSELFPTYTRNSMLALCSSVGRIGGIAAPLTPLLMVYWPGLPTVLFGITSLIGGLVTFFVPETGQKSLPDTVLQAEALGDTEIKIHSEESDTSSRRKDCCTYL